MGSYPISGTFIPIKPPKGRGETPKEAMSRQAWHLLAQQMTHAINCDTQQHTEEGSCVDFTEGSHAELMAHIETYVDARLSEAQKFAPNTTK